MVYLTQNLFYFTFIVFRFTFTLSKQKRMMEGEVHFKENDHIIIAGDSMGLFPGDR